MKSRSGLSPNWDTAIWPLSQPSGPFVLLIAPIVAVTAKRRPPRRQAVPYRMQLFRRIPIACVCRQIDCPTINCLSDCLWCWCLSDCADCTFAATLPIIWKGHSFFKQFLARDVAFVQLLFSLLSCLLPLFPFASLPFQLVCYFKFTFLL